MEITEAEAMGSYFPIAGQFARLLEQCFDVRGLKPHFTSFNEQDNLMAVRGLVETQASTFRFTVTTALVEHDEPVSSHRDILCSLELLGRGAGTDTRLEEASVVDSPLEVAAGYAARFVYRSIVKLGYQVS
jgi:hypothetical protein